MSSRSKLGPKANYEVNKSEERKNTQEQGTKTREFI
jgi:hypothetical protein